MATNGLVRLAARNRSPGAIGRPDAISHPARAGPDANGDGRRPRARPRWRAGPTTCRNRRCSSKCAPLAQAPGSPRVAAEPRGRWRSARRRGGGEQRGERAAAAPRAVGAGTCRSWALDWSRVVIGRASGAPLAPVLGRTSRAAAPPEVRSPSAGPPTNGGGRRRPTPAGLHGPPRRNAWGGPAGSHLASGPGSYPPSPRGGIPPCATPGRSALPPRAPAEPPADSVPGLAVLALSGRHRRQRRRERRHDHDLRALERDDREPGTRLLRPALALRASSRSIPCGCSGTGRRTRST